MSNNQLNPTKIFVIGIWLLSLVVSCQPIVSSNVGTEVATEALSDAHATALQDSTPITLTRSVFQPVSPTWTPIPSITSEASPQATSTLKSTETAISTPQPTLSLEEATSKVLSLLEENQNPDCLLPCWWGATPGQTHWQDVDSFLNSFAIKVETTSIGASVTFPLPESIEVPGFDYDIVYIWNESRVIQEIDIDAINIPGYDAKMMMTLYGVPNEIWLTTIDEPREGVLPFQLIIVYQQKGISFRYYVNATKTGEIITACFESGFVELERPDLFPAGPRIYVWDPGPPKEIAEISPIPLERYYLLETKTDLTPETVHAKFTNPNEQPCIDTPADLWRN